MKAIVSLLVSMMCCLACTATSSENQKVRERLVSENVVLKKQIIAIERRNSLLEEENNLMHKTVKVKEAEIEKTESNLKSVKEQLLRDKRIFEGKFENLQKKLVILDRESKGKIKDLIKLNSGLELKLNKKIKHLNAEILASKQKFAATVELMKKKNAAREFDLNKKIISGKEVISKLKKDLTEAKSEVEEKDEVLRKQIAEQKKHLQEIAKLESEFLKLKSLLEVVKKDKKNIIDEKKKLLEKINKLSGKKK